MQFEPPTSRPWPPTAQPQSLTTPQWPLKTQLWPPTSLWTLTSLPDHRSFRFWFWLSQSVTAINDSLFLVFSSGLRSWLIHRPLTPFLMDLGRTARTHHFGYSHCCRQTIALMILVLAQSIHDCHCRLTGLGVLLWFSVLACPIQPIVDLGCTCSNLTPSAALGCHAGHLNITTS